MRFHVILRSFTLVVVSLAAVWSAGAATIRLLPNSATVWARQQTVQGTVSPPLPGSGTLIVNGVPQPFTVGAPGDSFAVPVTLGNGTNIILAHIDSSGHEIVSDTLRLTLGYRLRPEIQALASVQGMNVTLHASVVANPLAQPVQFSWSQDTANPVSVSLGGGPDSVAFFAFPGGAPPGEYYFDLQGVTPGGDTSRARTMVTVDSGGVRPFDIERDHARWVDKAIVYGITPSIFVANGMFADITAKLPEIAGFGVNALWIQPVFTTHFGGQGYDVIDYFGVRSELGGAPGLRALIAAAHALGLKVILDFVPNHTSISHPYAQEAIASGAESHYYDFYQRVPDTAPYSSNEHIRTDGKMQFVYYFWQDLPNLNYDHPEVRRMITEAALYWVEQFGVDGYRVDVTWAVNARRPEFFKEWRLALKRLKPELLLLGEDKASVLSSDPYGRPCPFDRRFDVAYDWTNEPGWVSHWSWQTIYSANANNTIFNSSDETSRVAALRKALNNNAAGYDSSAIIFRFMENNDTFRFLATHDLARTKMVAALLFALNGIPQIFNGQEIGASAHPYSAFSIFNASSTIRSQDPYGLTSYYTYLAGLRKRFPAFSARGYQEMTVSPSTSVFAFRRSAGNQHIFTLTNMRTLSFAATLTIPVGTLGLDTARTYYLTDLMSGQFISGKPASLSTTTISMPAMTTRMFALADSVISVTAVEEEQQQVTPGEFALEQNYPNPFNPVTSIEYTVGGVRNQASGISNVRLVVYDVIGREVAVLVNETRAPGRYEVRFDGSGLSSGVYFYRLTAGSLSESRKMLLLK